MYTYRRCGHRCGHKYTCRCRHGHIDEHGGNRVTDAGVDVNEAETETETLASRLHIPIHRAEETGQPVGSHRTGGPGAQSHHGSSSNNTNRSEHWSSSRYCAGMSPVASQ